jgi:uncharacterized protein with FMN-binding domain
MDTNNKKIAGIIGLVVIVAAIAVGALALSPKPASVSDTPTASATPTPTPVTSVVDTNAAPTAAPAASGYKDGAYSATGSYNSPGGIEKVSVKLTLKDGVVADSTVTTTGNNPTGREYQAMFVSGYKSLVIGKNIDQIHLSRVSGSSLTSAGFNNALTQIKSQAKS